MKNKLEEFVGMKVAIRSVRIPDGQIVTLNKDKFGVYWDEPPCHKSRPEDEKKLEVFILNKIK